jgi:hypothetical protein
MVQPAAITRRPRGIQINNARDIGRPFLESCRPNPDYSCFPFHLAQSARKPMPREPHLTMSLITLYDDQRREAMNNLG